MSTVVSSTNSEFEVVPEGVYLSRCVQVIDLGEQEVSFKGSDPRWVHQLRLAFEILDDETVMKDGRHYMVVQTYTASLNEKSRLYRDLVSWRGTKFTDEELKAFDVKNLLDVPCQIQIVHNDKGYPTITNIIKSTTKNDAVPKAQNELWYFDMDAPEMELFAKLSSRLQENLRKAHNWTELVDGDLNDSGEVKKS